MIDFGCCNKQDCLVILTYFLCSTRHCYILNIGVIGHMVLEKSLMCFPLYIYDSFLLSWQSVFQYNQPKTLILLDNAVHEI